MSRPRIRSLKPDIWEDEAFGALSPHARLLFIGLITMADDEGRLRALPAAVVGHVFPYEDVSTAKLRRLFLELVGGRLVELYDANGVPYAQVVGWAKHQRISHPKKSSLPQAPAEGVRKTAGGSVDEARNSDGTPPEELRNAAGGPARPSAGARRVDRKGTDNSNSLKPSARVNAAGASDHESAKGLAA